MLYKCKGERLDKQIIWKCFDCFQLLISGRWSHIYIYLINWNFSESDKHLFCRVDVGYILRAMAISTYHKFFYHIVKDQEGIFFHKFDQKLFIWISFSRTTLVIATSSIASTGGSRIWCNKTYRSIAIYVYTLILYNSWNIKIQNNFIPFKTYVEIHWSMFRQNILHIHQLSFCLNTL